MGRMTSKSEDTEFDKFNRTMRELIKVSHSEIKAKLDAEKKKKKHTKEKHDGKNDNND